MWGMRTETVSIIVGALELIKEGMDQNSPNKKTPLVPQDQGMVRV